MRSRPRVTRCVGVHDPHLVDQPSSTARARSRVAPRPRGRGARCRPCVRTHARRATRRHRGVLPQRRAKGQTHGPPRQVRGHRHERAGLWRRVLNCLVLLPRKNDGRNDAVERGDHVAGLKLPRHKHAEPDSATRNLRACQTRANADRVDVATHFRVYPQQLRAQLIGPPVDRHGRCVSTAAAWAWPGGGTPGSVACLARVMLQRPPTRLRGAASAPRAAQSTRPRRPAPRALLAALGVASTTPRRAQRVRRTPTLCSRR